MHDSCSHSDRRPPSEPGTADSRLRSDGDGDWETVLVPSSLRGRGLAHRRAESFHTSMLSPTFRQTRPPEHPLRPVRPAQHERANSAAASPAQSRWTHSVVTSITCQIGYGAADPL
jgi:hypothetical protein